MPALGALRWRSFCAVQAAVCGPAEKLRKLVWRKCHKFSICALVSVYPNRLVTGRI